MHAKGVKPAELNALLVFRGVGSEIVGVLREAVGAVPDVLTPSRLDVHAVEVHSLACRRASAIAATGAGRC
jgi:hypothetical protein